MGMPSFNMKDKVALITGGRTGIGRALALAFAEAGADVTICSRTDKGDGLEGVAAEIRKMGRRALAVRADVSRKSDVENMVEETISQLGDIDILINNAGFIARRSLLETEEDVWDSVIDTNLKGCYLSSRAVGRLMVKRGEGSIINIASVTGLRANLNRAAYSIAKAGVIMMTKVLARELGTYSIRVNAIAPWLVKTRMNEDLRSDIKFTESALSSTPLGRFGETGDIVGIALFLASDAASWITGQTIVADGGHFI